MKLNKKTLLAVVAVAAVVALAIGGTLAWLQGTAEETVTLSGSDRVTISMTGATIDNADKVIPGQVISYDPTVNVKASVAAFAFIQIKDEKNVLGTTPPVTNDWTALGDAYPGVYYKEIAAQTGNNLTEGQTIHVFTNGMITISNGLDNASIATLNEQVSIRAAAIQKAWINGQESGATAVQAWEALNPTSSTDG